MLPVDFFNEFTEASLPTVCPKCGEGLSVQVEKQQYDVFCVNGCLDDEATKPDIKAEFYGQKESD